MGYAAQPLTIEAMNLTTEESENLLIEEQQTLMEKLNEFQHYSPIYEKDGNIINSQM